MKKAGKSIFFLLLFMISCNAPDQKVDLEKLTLEITEVEKQFNDLAQKEGIAKAFATYAAEDGVIMRNGELIKGKQAITRWYQNSSRPNVTLTWKPDFVDVSNSGDMAYTYGTYQFSSVDSTGTAHNSSGTFHTVWKRQKDGSWRFVWD